MPNDTLGFGKYLTTQSGEDMFNVNFILKTGENYS
jgi:hypothetical protein